MTDNWERQVDRAYDSAAEVLFSELDRISRKHGISDYDMVKAVQSRISPDVADHYEEWLQLDGES